jgi:hypothetical protein
MSGRDLSRHEAEPGAGVTAATEGGALTDRRHHGTGDDRADAGYRHQPLASFVIASQGLDLAGHLVDALVEMMPVSREILDHVHHSRRQGIGAIGQDVWLQSQEMSILAPSGFRRVCAENKRLLLWNDAYPPTFSCQARDALHRIYGGRTMASWVGAARKSRSLKELDVGDLYDQLESMGA